MAFFDYELILNGAERFVNEKGSQITQTALFC